MNAKTGITPAIISCILAVLGIFTLGILFIPLAACTALIATIVALKNRHFGGIGLAILAWVLTIVGFASSPVLWSAIGLSTR